MGKNRHNIDIPFCVIKDQLNEVMKLVFILNYTIELVEWEEELD